MVNIGLLWLWHTFFVFFSGEVVFLEFFVPKFYVTTPTPVLPKSMAVLLDITLLYFTRNASRLSFYFLVYDI